MSWLRLDDQIADHPKFLAAGPQAAWLWVCGLSYASRYLTDGYLPTAQVRTLGGMKGNLKLADRLVDAGLWEEVEGGYQIHDYHDFQPTAESERAKRAAARERQRKRRSGEPVSRSLSHVTKSVTDQVCPADVTPDARPRARTGARPGPGPARPGPARPTESTPERYTGEGKRVPAGADDPPPTKTNGLEISGDVDGLEPLFAAFESVGLPRPKLRKFDPRDAADLLRDYEPDVIARCWQDIASGEYGDDFDRSHLSFSYLAGQNRVDNWLRQHQNGAADDGYGEPILVEGVRT